MKRALLIAAILSAFLLPPSAFADTVYKTFTISNSSTETTVWTPASGKKFRLTGYALYSDTATVLTFKDNTSGTTIWKCGVGQTQYINSPSNIGNGILSAAANNVLTLTCGTAATVNGVVFGREE